MAVKLEVKIAFFQVLKVESVEMILQSGNLQSKSRINS